MAEPAGATLGSTLGQQLAAFAIEVDRCGPPRAVAASVRDRVLDVLGLCLAARDLPTSRAIVEHIREQGGTAQAYAVGVAEATTAPLAALANGVFAHSLDYDDTHLPSVLHPSASVVPAALAAADLAGASGRRLTGAIAAGLEVCVRLGMAGFDPHRRASVYFDHGQHATSICGALGGAVAAAILLDLPAGGVSDALGLAASMAAGVIEANRTGGTVKRLHCGWAAHSAVTAAALARRGFTGPPTVLEGRFGFFQAFLRGEFDAAQVTEGLGERWAVPDIFFKPYPANHFTHAVIDAGIALRAGGLDPDGLASVTLGVPAAVIRTIGEPIEAKRSPQTGYQAQFSGPYAFVAGLLGGGGLGVAHEDFTDALAQDPYRRALMAKVAVVAEPRCDEIFPDQFPAIVSARTRDGQVRVAEVLANRGGPQRPLSIDELTRKFYDNAAAALPAAAAARVAQLVGQLDQLPKVTELTRLLAAAGDRRE